VRKDRYDKHTTALPNPFEASQSFLPYWFLTKSMKMFGLVDSKGLHILFVVV
jgi:hypothetical protein